MRYMLDTNTLSDIARNKSQAARLRLDHLSFSHGCLSSVTYGEALFGLEKRPLAMAIRVAVLNLIEGLEVLPWGDEEARTYGALRARLQSSGVVIGSLDLLIAAHALCVGATLVTRDRSFRQIPGLAVENWATDLQ